MESIISGAVAGLAVSMAVGIFGWTRHWFRRSRQLKALRDLINKGHSDYLSDWTDSQIVANREAIRAAQFSEFVRNLKARLESGVPDLSFEERYKIGVPLLLVRWLTDEHDAAPHAGAASVFNMLREIPELKLTYDPASTPLD